MQSPAEMTTLGWQARQAQITFWRLSSTPIPLTPALSPSDGERENPRLSAGESEAAGSFESQPLVVWSRYAQLRQVSL